MMTFTTLHSIFHSALPASGQGIFNQPMNVQQQQQLQLQLQQDNRLKALLAIKVPGIFGDERDQILVKFNMLQACCGTGKGWVNYNGQQQAVDFTTDNPVCRFKVCVCVCVHALMNTTRGAKIAINCVGGCSAAYD